MRLGPLRYVMCALVAALVVFTSGGAAAGVSASCTESDFALHDFLGPDFMGPGLEVEASAELAEGVELADGGVSAEVPLASMPDEEASPPALIPSDDACDPAYQVEAGPAMCTTEGASAVAPRVIHPAATTTLDAPEPCGPEFGVGATYDHDEQPHQRAPSVALEACLFATPSLPPPPVAEMVPSVRPRESAGRQSARRLDRPPRG